MWVAEYLDDIESDLSVFHRVSDIHSMPSRQFFKLVPRLVAYKGVLRARVEEEMSRKQGRDPNARTVNSDANTLQSEFGEFIEVKRG